MKKELGTFLLLVLLCVVVAVLNPRFLAPANLQNMARLIGAYGIFSIGLGMVIITGASTSRSARSSRSSACCSR